MLTGFWYFLWRNFAPIWIFLQCVRLQSGEIYAFTATALEESLSLARCAWIWVLFRVGRRLPTTENYYAFLWRWMGTMPQGEFYFTFMDRRVKCDSRQRQSLNFKSGCKTKLFEADQKVPKPPLPNDSKFIRKIMFTTSLRSQENFPRTKDVCVFARNKRKEFS